ncbi:MAG: hypothetical protein E6G97_17980 [Alphaproteobacteria bacterium]|nr:MAG: hypothetical protein E6G97_17980 [Alphaproteobacteria bacterium]
MSEQNFPQAEYDLLIEQVHAPVFFEKLARDYGVVPASEEEKLSLLELAGVLQTEEARELEKKASSPDSPIIRALDDLKKIVAAEGRPHWPTSHQRMLKAAASELAQREDLAEAAARFGAWLARGA